METKDKKIQKGYKGAVDRLGNFYPFEKAEVLTASHDKNFRRLTLEELGQDPRIAFLEVKDTLPHPEFYDVNYQDYDFKALAIDFLGFCSFSIYGEQLGNYAAIEVPNPNIYGYSITREQQETLCKLVEINHCSLESLKPVFQTKTYDVVLGYQYEKTID